MLTLRPGSLQRGMGVRVEERQDGVWGDIWTKEEEEEEEEEAYHEHQRRGDKSDGDGPYSSDPDRWRNDFDWQQVRAYWAKKIKALTYLHRSACINNREDFSQKHISTKN